MGLLGYYGFQINLIHQRNVEQVGTRIIENPRPSRIPPGATQMSHIAIIIQRMNPNIHLQNDGIVGLLWIHNHLNPSNQR